MHYAELKAAWAELTGPGAPFEVTTVEVRGQQLRIYAHAPRNVREVWLSTAAFADREYLVYQDERITYAQAHAASAAIACWLARQGVRQGDRVAIAMRNYPEWMLIYWACVSTGITVVGMNAWWVAEEMAQGLQNSEPKVIFADGERLARLFERPLPEPAPLIVAVRAPTDRPGLIAWSAVVAEPGALPEADIDGDEDACIFYTSGTTGFPKGAQLTHRGCVNNLFNMVFGGQSATLATQRATGVIVDPAAPAPIPVALVNTPLFHVTANNCLAYAATAGGGKMVLMYKWEAGEALRLIEQERVTSMSGVPTMARELIHHPDFRQRDLTSLMTLGGGGAQVPPDLVGKIDEYVPGARPNTGYGMTETCGIITSVSGDFFVHKPDTAGPAMPTFEAKCVDDDGAAVAPGALGELWVRGAGVIKGYLNRPDATAETITDGWLHTGDIARIDENGFIFVVDRKKEMVLRGGENVYCAEVEAALFRHPSVAEACVFGVADERLGEEVGAAVVLRAGEAASAEDLRLHLSELISRHKSPRYLWLLTDPLPRNASGKFVKRQLREALQLEHAH